MESPDDSFAMIFALRVNYAMLRGVDAAPRGLSLNKSRMRIGPVHTKCVPTPVPGRPQG